MRTYQSVVILKPDFDDSQIGDSTEKISQQISKFGGSILKSEVWGKKRLAYRVKKNRFGIYLNFCHTLENKNVSAFENELRLDDAVIKYLVIRLEQDEIDRICGDKTAPIDDEDDGDTGDEDDEEKPRKTRIKESA